MDSILTQDERLALIPRIAMFINGNPVNLTTVIPEQHFIRITTNTTPETYAYNIVRYCEMSAWLEDPALIVRLLEKFKVFAIFEAALNRIKNGTPIKYFLNARPWDTMAVPLNLPFLNRKITRTTIESFSHPLSPALHPPGNRVLVVKGPSKSGKTFTGHYISYINSIFRNFKIVSVDLKKQISSRITPLDLTYALLNQINPDWRDLQIVLPEPDVQQVSRWTLQLCGIIIDQIAYINEKCIIILDGFDEAVDAVTVGMQRIPADTIEMVIYLAAIAAGRELANESNDLIRLVLLGFNQPITILGNRIRIDNIQPLNEDDIKSYFLRYAQCSNKNIDPDGIADLVTATLENDNLSDPNRTQRLAERVQAIAIGVFS